MESLGRDYDLSVSFVPVDTQTGINTGDVINLRNAGGVDVILFKDNGVANDDPILTFWQCVGVTGTPAALLVDHYYKKEGLLLTAVGSWTRVANGVAGTGITTITGAATSAEHEAIWVVPIEASQLADGYDCIQVSLGKTGVAGAQLGCMLYLLRGLHHQRTPANLASPII